MQADSPEAITPPAWRKPWTSILPALRLLFCLPMMPSAAKRPLLFHRKQRMPRPSSLNQSWRVGLFMLYSNTRWEMMKSWLTIMPGSSTATPPIRQETATPDWVVPDVQEFVPQQFEPSSHSHLVRPRRPHLCSTNATFEACLLCILYLFLEDWLAGHRSKLSMIYLLSSLVLALHLCLLTTLKSLLFLRTILTVHVVAYLDKWERQSYFN